MSLTLSASDLARLAEAQHVLLARLEFESAAAWHAALCASLRTLIAADHASLFESGAAPVLHCSTLEDALLREYLTEHVERDPVTQAVAARGIECGCTWDVISPREFRRTAFYHEYVRPNAVYDAAGYRVRSGPRSHAWLTFQYAREHDEQTLHRHTALLRLLLPAFRAGVQLERRLGAWGAHAAAAVDAQEERVLLCDAAGRALHANAALRRALDADPEGASMHEAMCALAREVAARADGHPIAIAARRLGTALGRYDALAVLAGPALAPAHVAVVLQPHAATDDELRARFGLTVREVAVARLLAAGCTNAALAAELAISPFTARRHTERVLRKLGVATRAQVAGRLGG